MEIWKTLHFWFYFDFNKIIKFPQTLDIERKKGIRSGETMRDKYVTEGKNSRRTLLSWVLFRCCCFFLFHSNGQIGIVDQGCFWWWCHFVLIIYFLCAVLVFIQVTSSWALVFRYFGIKWNIVDLTNANFNGNHNSTIACFDFFMFSLNYKCMP